MLTSDELILEPVDEVGADALKTTPAILLCQLGGFVLLFSHGGSCCGGLDWFTWRDRLGNSGLSWFGCRFRFRLLFRRFLLVLVAIMRSLCRFYFGDFGPGCVEGHLDLI